MAKITYHIKYANEKAKVTITPKNAKFNPGDQVSFKSNSTEAAIRYPQGSPFKQKDLPARKIVTVPFGPVPLKANRPNYHFECGEIKRKVSRKNHVSVRFTPLPGGGGNTPHNP